MIIGIGFIAVSQLTSFAIGSMDRSMERIRVGFMQEIIYPDRSMEKFACTLGYKFDLLHFYEENRASG